MTEIDYAQVLLDLVPNASFRVQPPFDDYYAIVWMDERPQPSLSECNAAWPRVHAQAANAEAQAKRRIEFAVEADPLFFGWQRSENSEQDWLDKVQEIRDRHPYVDVPK